MTEERNNKKGAGRTATIMMASVALNCFLIGLLAGPALRDGVPAAMQGSMPRPPMMDGGQRPDGGPMMMFTRVFAELPPDEATKARAIIETERKDFHDKRKEMRAVMTSLAQILKQDTPDKDQIGKTLESVAVSGKALHDGMVRTFERMATELSAESRRKIAAAIEAHEKFMEERGGPDRMGDRRGPHGPQPDDEP